MFSISDGSLLDELVDSEGVEDIVRVLRELGAVWDWTGTQAAALQHGWGP